MPGVLALSPPKTAARGREQERLLVYLALTGNAVVASGEYRQLAEDTASVYYQTQRAVTSALRAAADSLNKTLLERNMNTSGQGQYALAWLALAAFREGQCIFSLNGPMHGYWFGANGSRHFFEPSISGKGLGSSQSMSIHYAQAELGANDLMLFCARVPSAWSAPLDDAQPSSFDSMRRRLTALTNEDLNAVLLQTTEGAGTVNFMRAPAVPKTDAPRAVEQPQEEKPAPPTQDAGLPVVPDPEAAPGADAHRLQPSAYAIPRREEETSPLLPPDADPLSSLPHKTTPRDFPASIPRAKPADGAVQEQREEIETEEPTATQPPPQTDEPSAPREPSPQAKQAAKAVVNLMQGFRAGSVSFGERFRNFLPRLLPASESSETPSISAPALMAFMAVLIPLIVVVIATVMYLRYGRNEQYDAYYNQALQLKQQALALTNPVEQRLAWENVLANVDRAEQHNVTNDTIALREEARARLDELLGIHRLKFSPAFSVKPGMEVSRMAANNKDLYLLNAANGEALRAIPSGNGGFELDPTFDCKPGVNNNAGPLVDILTLPIANVYGATMLGIDAVGNLLYCKPGAVPQTGLLPAPDTNWGRITGFALDGGSLYVLDAPSRAVWVYTGKELAFVDRPYFFFGQQTPAQDVIDFLVSGDEMYLLHADGRLSTCIYSRMNVNASKCQDPLDRINPFPAYADTDLFAEAHFTQLLFAAPPDPSLLLLDADGRNVMRFAPRALELQTQFQPAAGGAGSLPPEPVGAVAVSPDHVLYLAINGQVYFAVNMP